MESNPLLGWKPSTSRTQKFNYTWSLLCIYSRVCSQPLCEAFWICTGNCCRVEQLQVCETGGAPGAAQCVDPPSALLPPALLLPTDPDAQVSRCFPRKVRSPGPSFHVRSFRMTVARMRKKVFQPRVTAKPRHTMNWDRPQPAKNTWLLACSM